MTTMETNRLAVPGPSPEVEAERRRALRVHKAIATGLLLVAAVIFLACRFYESTGNAGDWVGFVRAGAEAGMVGGLADWFAVTALFRYPLGLKIPHTAIIRRKKDQVGEALSGFVGENFLNAELITEKVSKAKVPERVAEWMVVEGNAQKVSREAGKLVANATRALDPQDAEAVIRTALVDRIAEPAWGPPLGRTLDQLINEGQTEPIVEQLIQWMHRKALSSEDLIVRILDERAPTWAPKFINDIVGDKVYRELVTWTEQVANDRNHEARQAVRRFIYQFSQDLQYDPVMIQRVEDIKHDVMGSKPVQDAAKTVWSQTSAAIIAAAEDPESILRTKLVELTMQWGQRLRDDDELRASLDRRITGTAAFLADNYAGEVTSIISETIERWDADEASDKIELMVGKDLQYIRLNGTVVGALAGLAIYTVSYLFFGV
ncbi:DUF445 domain-containing protein [Corynebacterium vitaeruminis]|uniref:DUF445 domain-containing protein n=1 Tax=Corynebacterium vitaeruminis DSM 20294 TaxID=1224164 RepID=W5XYJ0_9CORY|nr:DUF445 family protein [Corynebacterium vitaeruminis]AHI21745.1 hypothetical protein B843_01765 [Corynebacterium vitaeruminis DSM 20294]